MAGKKVWGKKVWGKKNRVGHRKYCLSFLSSLGKSGENERWLFVASLFLYFLEYTQNIFSGIFIKKKNNDAKIIVMLLIFFTKFLVT